MAILTVACAVVCGCGGMSKIQGGKLAPGILSDGVFEGKSSNGPVKVEVRVTVADRKIAGIELVKHRTWKGKKAETPTVERIIAQQSTSVETVSGATRSSIAIMNAVQDALGKATR